LPAWVRANEIGSLAHENYLIGLLLGHCFLALVLLHQYGYRNAINMSGGMTAWHKAEYPVAAAPSSRPVRFWQVTANSI
jgi:hypothetical protein